MRENFHILVIQGLKQIDMKFDNNLVLIPQPYEITSKQLENSIKIEPNSKVHFINVKDSEFLLNNLNESFKDLFNFTLNNVNPEDLSPQIINLLEKNNLIDDKNEDAYNLLINDEVILIYSISDKGLFYGIQTFIQICKNYFLNFKSKNQFQIILPQLEIRDKPDLKIRGIAQDISRGQVFTIENAKRYIRIISHYKLNFYCLYIEDMFSHPDHPLIGKNRGALTCGEIKELDTYAKQYYVELVPIFECLGHVDNILQHKKYQELGEFPGAQCLDISNPAIYPFLTDYISEMSKCFSTTYFHIGCDETFDIGKYNSKEFIQNKGKGQILKEFYEKVYSIAKDQGNENIIMYDDIVRKDDYLLENLNKDIIMMYWNYSPKKNFKNLECLFNAGFRVIVSPSMLNWNRNFPDNENASKNIMGLIDEAYKYVNKNCLGVLTSTWGDQRYFSLRENEIFGAILTAGKSWNVNKFIYDDFKKKYGYLFYGLSQGHLEKFNELINNMSEIVISTYRFVILLPPLFYTDLFKHPFPSLKFKPANKDYKKIKKLAQKCLKLWNELREFASFELENFDYMEFGARLAETLGEKIELSVGVSKKLQEKQLSTEEKELIIKGLKEFRDKFKNVKNRYKELWLRAAKLPCLTENLKLFDQVIKAYDNKIIQINQDILFKDPFLPSEWIWVHEKSCPKKPRYFRKEIEIRKTFNRVIIQGTVCNQMKIYVNNEQVGEVLGRLSLSRLPILLRVKKFDITNEMKIGKNIIAVKATNYDGYKGAFNIFGQIKYDEGEIQEFISDSTWKCYDNDPQDTDLWKSVEFQSQDWKYAKSYGKPPSLNGELIKPNLLEGEISLTQDYFGAQGYLYNGLSIFMNKYIVKMFKFIIPIIVKIAKLFG